jgi:hypothetical protein
MQRWPKIQGETRGKELADRVGPRAERLQERVRDVVHVSGRKFHPRKIQPADLDHAAEMRKTVETRRVQLNYVRNLYTHVCMLNNLVLWSDDSIYVFYGMMVSFGLAPSTIDNYLCLLQKAERERLVSDVRIALDEVRKVTGVLRAAKKGEHAVDFVTTLDAVRMAHLQQCPVQRACLLAMLVLGPRRADIARLRPADVAFIREEGIIVRVVFDLRVTKGIRRANCKKRITLMQKHLNFPPEILEEVADTLESGKLLKMKHFPIDGSSVYTVASFRRNYVWRRIKECTIEGVTDYTSVCKYTGHLKGDTIEAYYLKDLHELDDL